MASIKISELRPSGSELFQDSESFLNELNDQATLDVFGGGLVISVKSFNYGVASIYTASVVSIVKIKKP